MNQHTDTLSVSGYEHRRFIFHDPILLPAIRSFLPSKPVTILDAGCGNGALTAILSEMGHRSVGIDVGESGIEFAKKHRPSIPYYVASVLDDLSGIIPDGAADVVIACEVIEHLYLPGKFLDGARRALKPGGRIIVTTPYHGYIKNLAISLLDGWDNHFGPARDGGHIKFFSKATLSSIMQDHGFTDLQFRGAGRLPYLWKSMVICGTNTQPRCSG